MSKEKQTEEMAKVIDEFTEPLSAKDIHKADFSEKFAETLYNAGYRKQSEVAREIFEEIENILKTVMLPCVNDDDCITPLRASYWSIDPNDYLELKKKYTEEWK